MVTVIAANVELPRSPGISYIDVESAQQLRDATLDWLERTDVLLMAAAVADYAPAQPEQTKIAKQDHDRLEVELTRTADVLGEAAARRRPDQTLIGFAAEFGTEGVERARVKLDRKQVDAFVVNDISRDDIGFDSEHNAVTIISKLGDVQIAKSTKNQVAHELLDFVHELRSAKAKERST
jgi:phosphopantothenoylcysteine decarboxylase/phosphopantothenate--cysteine ligase